MHVKTHTTDDQGEGYRFLDKSLTEAAIARVRPEQLVLHLGRVLRDIRAAGGVEAYERFRGQYIAINRALNWKTRIAPRFRPTQPTGWQVGARTTRAQRLLSNDHQVLDLEWLAFFKFEQGEPLPQVANNYALLFHDGLDLEEAARFVGTGGKPQIKAETILSLPVCDQLMLRSIQSEPVRQWWKHRRNKRDEVRQLVISAQPGRPRLIGKDVEWSTAWLAKECAAFAGRSATEWSWLISGREMPASTISHAVRQISQL